MNMKKLVIVLSCIFVSILYAPNQTIKILNLSDKNIQLFLPFNKKERKPIEIEHDCKYELTYAKLFEESVAENQVRLPAIQTAKKLYLIHMTYLMNDFEKFTLTFYDYPRDKIQERLELANLKKVNVLSYLSANRSIIIDEDGEIEK